MKITKNTHKWISDLKNEKFCFLDQIIDLKIKILNLVLKTMRVKINLINQQFWIL